MFFIVASHRFAEHLPPPGHPDRPTRAHVMDAVASRWAARGVSVVAPTPALLEDLLHIHSAEYVEMVDRSDEAMRLDPDTFTSRASGEVARLAVGGAVDAVDRVLASHSESPGSAAALVMARPPGHHAERARAMGFCIYNTVAIAAAHALARGVPRVAIVDYDVHHGNGTQQLFYDDPRVLFVSTHQYPFYPGTGPATDTGTGAGEGFTVNVPMEAGATDGDYRVVFERVVVPVVAAFRPQLLLVSAGFDAHMRDPMARMRLSVDGLTSVARTIAGAAERLSAPAVFVTEGGYHLRALGACLDELVGVLAEPKGRADTRLRPGLRRGRPGVCPYGEDDVVGQGFSLAEDDPLTVEDAPLIEDDVRGVTHRGPAAVELVRAAEKRYWPTL